MTDWAWPVWEDVLKVICNKREICSMSDECGGAKPHDPCSECGNCPKSKKLNAKCEVIKYEISRSANLT